MQRESANCKFLAIIGLSVKESFEFSNLQSKYQNLEVLYSNTKEELEMCKSELQVRSGLKAVGKLLGKYFFSAENEEREPGRFESERRSHGERQADHSDSAEKS